MPVARQHNSFIFRQADQQGFPTRYTHGPWSGSHTTAPTCSILPQDPMRIQPEPPWDASEHDGSTAYIRHVYTRYIKRVTPALARCKKKIFVCGFGQALLLCLSECFVHCVAGIWDVRDVTDSMHGGSLQVTEVAQMRVNTSKFEVQNCSLPPLKEKKRKRCSGISGSCL